MSRGRGDGRVAAAADNLAMAARRSAQHFANPASSTTCAASATGELCAGQSRYGGGGWGHTWTTIHPHPLASHQWHWTRDPFRSRNTCSLGAWCARVATAWMVYPVTKAVLNQPKPLSL